MIDASALGERGGHLVAERLTALDGEPVLVSLAREGQGAFLDRALEVVIGGVAGEAVGARADGDLGSERLQPAEHDGIGVRRDEHEQPPAAGRRDDRCGQRGVPAAGDGERRERAFDHA